MNIPDHISESLETIFWVKIPYLNKFFNADADADPGSGNLFNPGSGNLFDPGSENLFDPGSGIRHGKNSDPGSDINIPDPQPQHWFLGSKGGRESREVLSAVYFNCFLLTGAEETDEEIQRFVSPFRCRDWGKYARRRRMISIWIKRFSGEN